MIRRRASTIQGNAGGCARGREWFLILWAGLFALAGCAGTEEATEREEEPAAQAPPAVSFEMSTDTVDVLRRGERSSSAPLAGSDTIYSVQIGAFREADNAETAETQARERFPHPVLRLQDQSGLHHVRVGRFSTRKAAEELRTEMLTTFPRDYADCWIVRLRENE